MSNGDWSVPPQTQTQPPFAGPNDPQIRFGPDIPPDLQAFYTAVGFPVVACIILENDATHYGYIAVLSGIVGYAMGTVVGTSVTEMFFLDGTGPGTNTSFGLLGGTPASPRSSLPGLSVGGDGLNIVNTVVGAEFRIDSVIQGRGLTDWVQSGANTAAIAVETVVLTSNSVTFQAGRAYQVDIGGGVVGSIASNSALFIIRRTNLAGAIIQNTLGFGMNATAGIDQRIDPQPVLRNNTGAPITGTLALTMQAFGGTVTMVGAADRPRFMKIRDVGSAAQFPGAPQI